MIDVHCHFDLCDKPVEEIQRLERMKILTIGMTNLPSHFELGFRFTKNMRFIRLALGLHPLMANHHKTELSRFQRLLDQTSYIGEVGLDFSKEGFATKEVQIRSFEFVLQKVRGRKKIISVHSRKAEKEVLRLVRKYEIPNVVFHWYSGSLEVLRQLISCGYYVSVNPAMLRSTNGRRIIDNVPLYSVLTETDAPFTSNTDDTVQPGNVSSVILYLADLHSLKREVVEAQIKSNFNKLVAKIRN